MAQVIGVPDMQTAQQQYQQQEERERSNMPQYTDEVYLVPSHTAKDKNFTSTALFCLPPLGIFGIHHFYLRRHFFGIVYACTMGLFGIGWVVDWFRIGRLVRTCNQDTSEARGKGHWIYSKKYPRLYLADKSLLDAFLLWLPPFGLFGLYHFYLGRSRYGIFQACTFGFFGFGWFMDIFRLAYMVEKANTDVKLMKKGTRVGEDPYSTSDAYLLAIPFGLFGLHHFYMWNKSRAILFLCTFGVFGLGWLADLFQMTLIVKEANKKRELRARLQNALTQGAQPTTTLAMTTISQTNQGYVTGPGGHPTEQQGILMANTVNLPEPPPAYRASAAEGETVMEGDGVVVPPPSIAGPSSGYGGSAGGAVGAVPMEGIPAKH